MVSRVSDFREVYAIIPQETDLSILQVSPLTAMPAPIKLAAYLFIPFTTIRNLN